MSKKKNESNKKFSKPIEYTCQKCGSNNMIIDDFNSREYEGLSDGDLAEREAGNHGTMTCEDCGHAQEYDS
jgi:ribosomal protein S14